jgi:hypothetical protein
MNFQINDFIEFSEWIKTIPECYDTAKNISKSNSGIPVLETEDLYLFNLDKFAEKMSKYLPHKREHCPECQLQSEEDDCKCNSLTPTSVDGLYIKIIEGYYPKLYFIEIKSFDIYNLDKTSSGDLSIFDKCIDKFKNSSNDEIKDCLKRLSKFKKEIKNFFRLNTNLKALESLISIVPNLFLYYCHKNNFNKNDIDLNEFLSFLVKCEKEYILVYSNEGTNISQYKAIIKEKVQCENNLFQLQRLRRHPFENIRFFDLEETFISYITNSGDMQNSTDNTNVCQK